LIKEYLDNINNKETNSLLVSLKSYALLNNVPIITDDGINFIKQMINIKQVKSILEIGTAIGYSSISMALNSEAVITTIERDEEMYQKSIKNIKLATFDNRIKVIYEDALEVDESNLPKFDLIFIDAAKAQSIKFFNKYKTCLNDRGLIITDNLLFHDLVVTPIKDRNLKQLVKKIDNFNNFVVEQKDFDTYIYSIGDGMSLSIKKDVIK
jgi:predicted O-methyltransferase YrrM